MKAAIPVGTAAGSYPVRGEPPGYLVWQIYYRQMYPVLIAIPGRVCSDLAAALVTGMQIIR